jgi:hypothetical protein
MRVMRVMRMELFVFECVCVCVCVCVRVHINAVAAKKAYNERAPMLKPGF